MVATIASASVIAFGLSLVTLRRKAPGPAATNQALAEAFKAPLNTYQGRG
jgi:hypothetical protein